MNDRQLPPQSIEAEMSTLSGILVDNEAINRALEIITPDDLYRESHRKIMRAMIELYTRNEPCDLTTLTAILKKRGELEGVGGGAYLAALDEYSPMAANIAYYCKIVKEKALERRLITDVQVATQIIYSGGTIEDAVLKLENAIQPTVKQNSAPVAVIQASREAIKRIEQRFENRGQIQGIPYGLEGLDAPTSGMHRGELIIIAARPSMGKTALAVGNFIASACGVGLKGMLFTLEMSRVDIVDRLIAGQGVKYHHIRNGQLSDSDMTKIHNGMARIHTWGLFIDDTPAISLREIRAKARRQKRDGLDLIVVDYLQLMSMAGSKESNRTQGLGEISRGLKQLARELDVPVIALSQLSRAVDSRPDKRPMMSDLRDSGEIEQDADIILFPYRPAAYCQKCRDRVNDGGHNYREHQAKAEIIIEKQRAGERNLSIPVCWLGEYQRFDSI